MFILICSPCYLDFSRQRWLVILKPLFQVWCLLTLWQPLFHQSLSTGLCSLFSAYTANLVWHLSFILCSLHKNFAIVRCSALLTFPEARLRSSCMELIIVVFFLKHLLITLFLFCSVMPNHQQWPLSMWCLHALLHISKLSEVSVLLSRVSASPSGVEPCVIVVFTVQ